MYLETICVVLLYLNLTDVPHFILKKTPKAETETKTKVKRSVLVTRRCYYWACVNQCVSGFGENGQESYLKDDNESLQKSTFKMNKRQ